MAAGPTLALLLGVVMWSSGFAASLWLTAAVTTWVAIWWITEPIPIPATSLLPLSLFPLLGVLTPDQVALSFGNSLILLFLGGFMLSAAMEKSGAHRRLAMMMVRAFGSSSGPRLVCGFMVASAVLSMWISNAATAVMLLPIAMAVVQQTNDRPLKVSLLLGVAFGCSLGGIVTPVGTPPNLIFIKNYQELTGIEIGFVDWMKLTLPVTLVMLPLVGWWLTRRLKSIAPVKLPEVGNWRREEILTLSVFAVTASLWITRTQPFGGWRSWLNIAHAEDGSIALLGVVALFVIPNGNRNEATDKPDKLLDWATAKRIPWSILLLMAGGFCIASAFQSSGLSDRLAGSLSGASELPLLLLIGLICFCVTFMTELTSNTATTTLLMPILGAAAIGSDLDPRLVMVPATISASFAFMLPVATAPNAIIFGSEQLSVSDMARAGLALNLAGVVIVTLLAYFGL